MNYSMNILYEAVGISKQAVWSYEQRQEVFDTKVSMLLVEAEELREEHPGCGVEKMYYTLKPDFIGRDRFIDLFMNLGFRLKHKKNYIKTTRSGKIYYPNLIEGMLLNSSSQVWQSDITYIRLGDRFYYAVFIIDVYNKKIVGYNLSDHMRAEANLQALQMALKSYKAPQIHHSDRGSQYIYHKYINLLKSNNTNLSMGLTALDNAYAERINQTIKNEYLHYWPAKTFAQLRRNIKKAVDHYNNKRIHNNINRKTPQSFEKETLNLPLHNRPKAIIYTDGYTKIEGGIEPHFDFDTTDLQAPNCPIVYENNNLLNKEKTVNTN